MGEIGGAGNVAAICTALRAVAWRRGCAVRLPWTFRSPVEVGQVAEAEGFEVEFTELLPRPTELPEGMGAWLDTFAAPVLEQVAGAEAALAREEVLQLLKPSLCVAGRWSADYVRVRFGIWKPERDVT